MLEPDLIMQLDMLVNQPLFVLPDNTVMARAELVGRYPFAELQSTPEQIFAQQEIGVFPASQASLNQNAKEYLARDVGSSDELVMFEDFIGREARTGYKDRRPVERIVKTKVFLAREGWEDFIALAKHVRAIKRIVRPDMGASVYSTMLGGAAFSPRMSLEDSEGRARRLAQQDAELSEREARLARQQAEFEERMARQQAELEAKHERQKTELDERTQKLTDLLASLA